MTKYPNSAAAFGGTFVADPLGAFTDNALSLWVQDPTREYKTTRMDDAAYAQMQTACIGVCTDVLIIHRQTRIPWLGQRRIKPAQNFWWFIGGRRPFGKTPLLGVQAKFAEETSLVLPTERFIYLKDFECIFEDRQQEPQDTGSHTLMHTFAVELDLGEIQRAAGKLDPKEYFVERGLRSLTFLEQTLHIHPHVLEAHDLYLEKRRRI